MAQLMAIASGSINAATTWGVLEPTSFVLNESGWGTLIDGRDFAMGPVFTPGAVIVDGIGVNFTNVNPGVTISVSIRVASNDSAWMTGTAVTRSSSTFGGINNENPIGWQFFEFDAPVTLQAGTAYQLCADGYNGSSGMWSNNYCMRLWGTTQAPAQGDTLIIANSQGNAGGVITYTVTMDNTNTSFQYGEIHVTNGCVLSFGTTPATNYYLKLGGNLKVRYGGMLQIGTAGSRLPVSSTATIEFNSTSPAQYGLIVQGGILNLWGDNSRQWFTGLASTAAAGQPVVNVANASGWLVGDLLALAATGTNYAEAEFQTIQTVAGNSITCTNLAAVKTYTAGKLNEVVNLTKNIIIKGENTTNTMYMYLAMSATGTIDNTWIRYSGSSNYNSFGQQVIGVDGYSTASTPPALTLNNCSITDFQNSAGTIAIGINALGQSQGLPTTQTITFNSCAIVTLGNCASLILIVNTSAGATAVPIENQIFTNCVLMGPYNNPAVVLNSCRPTLTNLHISSCNCAGTVIIQRGNNQWGNYSDSTNLGTWAIHSCSGAGVWVGNNQLTPITISNVQMWNCVVGLCWQFNWNNNWYGTTMTCNNWTCDHISNYHIWLNGWMLGNLIFNNCSFDGPGTTGIRIENVWAEQLICNSCQFAPTAAHSAGDIVLASGGRPQLYLNNTTLGSPNQFVGSNTLYGGTWVAVQGLAGHKTWVQYGILSNDLNIYKSAPTSLRLTPNSSNKLTGPTWLIPAQADVPITLAINVRKSSTTLDGTGYTGSQPRLVVPTNHLMGVNSPTVLGTGVMGTGIWESIAGTIVPTSTGYLSFYVDCDGTAGWVNVDDLSCSTPLPDSTALTYQYLGSNLALYGLMGVVYLDTCTAFIEPRITAPTNYAGA